MAKFKPHNKECKNCKKTFWSTRDWHDFCEPKCRVSFWRIGHPTVTPDFIARIEKIEKEMGIK